MNFYVTVRVFACLLIALLNENGLFLQFTFRVRLSLSVASDSNSHIQTFYPGVFHQVILLDSACISHMHATSVDDPIDLIAVLLREERNYGFIYYVIFSILI